MNRLSWKQKCMWFAATSLLLVAAFGYFCRGEITLQIHAVQLTHASDDDARSQSARDLVSHGIAASKTISSLLATSTPEVRRALQAAIAELPSDHPAFAPLTDTVLDQLAHGDPGEFAGELLLKRTATPDGRLRVVEFLGHAIAGSVDAKRLACLIAVHEQINQAALLLPLLNDPDPLVRQSAIFAIGPDGPHAVASVEELLQKLSDPDADVRRMTFAALGTRGLDDRQIALGRKLKHPDAAVRLTLISDLIESRDAVKDTGPWLARLSRDTDPCIRAAAVRAAFECRVSTADWMQDVAERDSDPLVRRVAGHYLARQQAIRLVGGGER